MTMVKGLMALLILWACLIGIFILSGCVRTSAPVSVPAGAVQEA